MIEIDGSYGEGGGQILRTALSLSALTGQATHIHHIRAGRSKPGLAPQHLTAVMAVARICDARVSGAALRSTDIVFRPQTSPQAGAYVFDVTEAIQGGSAGSVTLILQALLMPLALASGTSHLILKGGTHVPWSPCFEYINDVYLPTLERMGVRATARLEQPGFYPRGGGRMTVDVSSVHSAQEGRPGLAPIDLTERGSLINVTGVAVSASLPAHIAQRMANRAKNVLASYKLPSDINAQRVASPGPGAYLFLRANYERSVAGFTSLGEKGKPSERVAEEACQDLWAFHTGEAAVDRHLADQLLLPMALANGSSGMTVARITRHLLTNAHVIQKFLPVHIQIRGSVGAPGAVDVSPIPES